MSTPDTWLVADLTNIMHRAWYTYPDADAATARAATWIASAASRIGTDRILLAVDHPMGTTTRRMTWPAYKAQRSAKDPGLAATLAAAPDKLRAHGLSVIDDQPVEADDLLAQAVKQADAAGWHSVLMTSDRDAFSLISPTARVLRMVNGGPESWPILTPDRLVELTGVTPEGYPLYAAIRGDTSDNLPGISGLGEKYAAALVNALPAPTLDALKADLESGAGLTRAAIGKARTSRMLDDLADTYDTLGRNLIMFSALPCQVPDPHQLPSNAVALLGKATGTLSTHSPAGPGSSEQVDPYADLVHPADMLSFDGHVPDDLDYDEPGQQSARRSIPMPAMPNVTPTRSHSIPDLAGPSIW